MGRTLGLPHPPLALMHGLLWHHMQVVGLTASPAADVTLAGTALRLAELRGNMGGAAVLRVLEDDADVAPVLAIPVEVEQQVGAALVD